MFNTIKTRAIATKNHLKSNKVAYAASAVAITAIAVQQSNLSAFYAFLEEKGIDPLEFINPEAFAEITELTQS